jgi:hypothetical protein
LTAVFDAPVWFNSSRLKGDFFFGWNYCGVMLGKKLLLLSWAFPNAEAVFFKILGDGFCSRLLG